MKRSKKYQAALAKVDKKKKYLPEEAIKLLPEVSFSKFPGSVQVEIVLNLNEKQKKEVLRGSYALPHQFGSTTKVVVFADAADQKKAAGADITGGEELIPDIESGKLQFDVLITTPAMMQKIARLAKVLGPKGLMPNPKNGTISTNLAETVKKFKSGMKQFKLKDGSKITAIIGKSDLEAEKLSENFQTFITVVKNELKKFGGHVVKTVKISPTMGPSISLSV